MVRGGREQRGEREAERGGAVVSASKMREVKRAAPVPTGGSLVAAIVHSHAAEMWAVGGAEDREGPELGAADARRRGARHIKKTGPEEAAAAV